MESAAGQLVALRYTVSVPYSGREPKPNVLRAYMDDDVLSLHQILRHLADDGVDTSALIDIRILDPTFDAWAKAPPILVLSDYPAKGSAVLIDLRVEMHLGTPTPSVADTDDLHQTPQRASVPPLLRYVNAEGVRVSEPGASSFDSRPLSEATSELVATGDSDTLRHGLSNWSSMQSLDGARREPSKSLEGVYRRGEAPSNRAPSFFSPPPLSHGASLKAGMAYEMPPPPQPALELVLLHAAPLVWRQGRMLMPLDHQSFSLDFKGEAKSLNELLSRAGKRVTLRYDVASASSLAEVLALDPVILHLVCHGDMDEKRLADGASAESAFFLGFEDAEGALDQLFLPRLHALLSPQNFLRGTKLVFVSACYSQPAAEVFLAYGVPHCVGVRADARVLDDAAAVFAQYMYLGLVQGMAVRAAFELGAATLAAATPTVRVPDPVGESAKFVLLPVVAPGQPDPHDAVLFPALMPGAAVERNPLPQLEPPYLPKPFLGRAIELRELVLVLGRKRQKEVRLVTLCGPAGVGKTSLAVAAAVYLFERRWFPDGCVCIELHGKRTEDEALVSLSEALDMDFRSLNDVSRALKNWRGLLLFTDCDAAPKGMLPPLLNKLLSTQELRVICTAREPFGVVGERVFTTKPLHKLDAARLFRELALEGLPPELRPQNALVDHPVLTALRGMPEAIWRTAPLLRRGHNMADLERDLLGRSVEPSDASFQTSLKAGSDYAAGPPLAGTTTTTPSPLAPTTAVPTDHATATADAAATTAPAIARAAPASAAAIVPVATAATTSFTDSDAATVAAAAPPLAPSATPTIPSEQGLAVVEAPSSALARPQSPQMRESVRHSFEASLSSLRETRIDAYVLLAVMSFLPGGARSSDLDAIWLPVASASASGSAAAATTNPPKSWHSLMQVLVSPQSAAKSAGGSSAPYWLVRQKRILTRGRGGASIVESAEPSGAQELYMCEACLLFGHERAPCGAVPLLELETARLHELIMQCAQHFADVGKRAVAELERRGVDAAAWTTEGVDHVLANMWACLSDVRLKVLRTLRTLPSTSDGAARHTAVVGQTLTRMLALLGRDAEAADAARQTISACQTLEVGADVVAEQNVLLGSQMLKLGHLEVAQDALRKAIAAFGADNVAVRHLVEGGGSMAEAAALTTETIATSTRLSAGVGGGTASPADEESVGAQPNSNRSMAAAAPPPLPPTPTPVPTPRQAATNLTPRLAESPEVGVASGSDVIDGVVRDGESGDGLATSLVVTNDGASAGEQPQSAPEVVERTQALTDAAPAHKWFRSLVGALVMLGQSYLASALEASDALRCNSDRQRASLLFNDVLQKLQGRRQLGVSETVGEVESRHAAATGLARLARHRGDAMQGVEILSAHNLGVAADDDAAVLELRGKCFADLADFKRASAALERAATLWRARGDGVRTQESLAALEDVRKRQLSAQVAAPRLVVMHAAPLVQRVEVRASTGATARLQPVAFSKRIGLRAWRSLLSTLRPLCVAVKVQFAVATRGSLEAALQEEDRPMLHFLPTGSYQAGLTLEGEAGELEPLGLERLRDVLAAAPSTPSLVFLSARNSEEVGRAFIEGGCPVVVALRGFLPEHSSTVFAEAFYANFLSGSASAEDAFSLARSRQAAEAPAPNGEYVLLTAADGASTQQQTDATLSTASPIVPGEMVDITPKLCPCNLPFNADDAEGGLESAADVDDSAAQDDEVLAHGSTFVGRHLDLHDLIHSCLSHPLTAVYGAVGQGKSALCLEAARFLRLRGYFPHGIFCCSLKGLRSMKQVRARLGAVLNFPARTDKVLLDHMAQYSSALLILDCCEAAIDKAKTQFYWFVERLLLAGVHVLIASQQKLHGFQPSDEKLERANLFREIVLESMSKRDSALLLLELCERDIDCEELGESEEVSVLDALRRHALLKKLGAPSSVRWAARKLTGVTVPELLKELGELKPREQAKLMMDSLLGGQRPELTPNCSVAAELLSARSESESDRRDSRGGPESERRSSSGGATPGHRRSGSGGSRLTRMGDELRKIAEYAEKAARAGATEAEAEMQSMLEKLQANFQLLYSGSGGGPLKRHGSDRPLRRSSSGSAGRQRRVERKSARADDFEQLDPERLDFELVDQRARAPSD